MSDVATDVGQMTETTPTACTAIQVRGLTATSAERTLVDHIDLDVPARGVTAIIGSSGSGKTTTALALMGEHRPGVSVTAARTNSAGVRFGFVPQHPSAVLNPVLRLGTALREIERSAHRAGSTISVAEALQRASFPLDRALLRRYPHQLSGGQQQRLVIAHALLTDPTCLIMDEPTTGQDPVHRSVILDEIAQLAESGLTIVLLTHDLGAVRSVADHVIVMAGGRVIETGGTDLLDAPVQEQTRALVGAESRTRQQSRPDRTASPGATRLSLADITAGFRKSAVLENFTVNIEPGECVALVGPSGCGKTTAARVAAGLHQPTAGRVLLDGRPLAGAIHGRVRSDLADIAYVAQDAKAAFDPYRTVWEQILRGPLRLRGATHAAAAAAATHALDRVGLDPQIALQRPGSLSGGEAQRAALARALAVQPSVLICDEVTTGLDPVAQQRVLELLSELTRQHAISLLVISHDTGVVRTIADDVVDMRMG